MKTHGQCNTKLYEVWEHIKARCLNSKDHAYKDYGGRGITVCKDWLEFVPFYKWALKSGYDEKLTIERIDVNKGYCPNNCKWATHKEQANNRRVNKMINYNGKTQNITQWAEELCINPDTLYSRVFRNGWSINKAFTTPIKKINLKGISFAGETNSIAGWARKTGIEKSLLWARINVLGWSVERSLGYEK